MSLALAGLAPCSLEVAERRSYGEDGPSVHSVVPLYGRPQPHGREHRVRACVGVVLHVGESGRAARIRCNRGGGWRLHWDTTSTLRWRMFPMRTAPRAGLRRIGARRADRLPCSPRAAPSSPCHSTSAARDPCPSPALPSGQHQRPDGALSLRERRGAHGVSARPLLMVGSAISVTLAEGDPGVAGLMGFAEKFGPVVCRGSSEPRRTRAPTYCWPTKVTGQVLAAPIPRRAPPPLDRKWSLRGVVAARVDVKFWERSVCPRWRPSGRADVPVAALRDVLWVGVWGSLDTAFVGVFCWVRRPRAGRRRSRRSRCGRYLCRGCGAVVTVLPCGVAPRLRYRLRSIAWALGCWWRGASAAAVRVEVSPFQRVGEERPLPGLAVAAAMGGCARPRVGTRHRGCPSPEPRATASAARCPGAARRR